MTSLLARSLTLPILLAALSAGGCSAPQGAAAQDAAVVNGKAIPAYLAEEWSKSMAGNLEGAALRDKAVQEMIDRELLAQAAEKSGAGNTAYYKSQIEFSRQYILMSALREDFKKTHPVSDAERAAAYAKLKEEASAQKEYHVRHIMFDSEDAAKALISRLKEGKDFEMLAKESTDTASASKGGDLGWVTVERFPPPFADEIRALRSGQTSPVPVATEGHFHVLRLDAVRAAAVPTVDALKERIEDEVIGRKYDLYVQQLRRDATIEIPPSDHPRAKQAP